MTQEPVQLEVRDRLHVLRLSHGANALDEVLLDALHDALDRQAEAGAPPLVLASAHPTVFCPGLDLRRLDGMPRDLFRPFLRRYNALLRRLLTYPGPTVAAIGGHAVAGGSLLVLACDRRVMARAGARLGLSEINLGIPLPAGTIAMLLALYPTRAVEQLVLDGDGFGGERALELGFVERVADADGVEDEACRLAAAARRPPRGGLRHLEAVPPPRHRRDDGAPRRGRARDVPRPLVLRRNAGPHRRPGRRDGTTVETADS